MGVILSQHCLCTIPPTHPASHPYTRTQTHALMHARKHTHTLNSEEKIGPTAPLTRSTHTAVCLPYSSSKVNVAGSCSVGSLLRLRATAADIWTDRLLPKHTWPRKFHTTTHKHNYSSSSSGELLRRETTQAASTLRRSY